MHAIFHNNKLQQLIDLSLSTFYYMFIFAQKYKSRTCKHSSL